MSTYVWCMLIGVNLLRSHRNEEKETKEVEQEHLGRWVIFFPNLFSYRILLVVSHDNANHEDNGDEEVANRCQNAKDQIIFRALIVDWQASNIRINLPSSY